MTIHYASIKNVRENFIFKSKFNLELFNTLVWNFAHIHSKSRKLGMFIFFQKCQFVYRNKVNSPPIREFPLFSF